MARRPDDPVVRFVAPGRRVVAFARALRSAAQHPAPTAVPMQIVDPEIVRMLRVLGIAMLETGQAVTDVAATLDRVARAYGAATIRVVVLPTVVIVQVPGAPHPIELDEVAGRSMRLDQTGAVATLVARAERGELAPATCEDEVAQVYASAPRFGPVVTVLGHAVLSLGFGLVLHPTLPALPAYALLGAIVGALVLVARRTPTLATALPVVAALVVTLVAGGFLANAVGDQPVLVLAPALFSLLPGMTLTIAALELTSAQIVAGASRMVYGTAQLLLLAFGVLAGASLLGGLHAGTERGTLGTWASWLGVLVVAVGYLLFSSAPPGAFWWITGVLAVAFAAQQLGGLVLDPRLSGFFGALVTIPVSRWSTRFRSAPPSVVTTIPAVWLLVPGALGFVGLTQAADGGPGAASLLDAAVAVFSIALGILVGTGLTRDAARVRSTWRRAGDSARTPERA